MATKGRRSAAHAFTVDVPRPLDAVRRGEHWYATVDGREIRLSNLTKTYWPEEGYTKGDLLAYYWNAAPRILPHLTDRPLTMKRMPDGVDGPYFYEKNAPTHTPDWIPRCVIHSPDASGGRIEYLMANDAAGILFVANLGCIEFHPLHSRCPAPDLPDYLFFDLDPFPPATFDDVLVVALHVRAALGALGLPCYPKTSGATGMQIYVPIVHGPTYQQVRDFVGAVGRAIRRVDDERVTLEWEIPKRAGKVFIDHNMNRQGANIAAVYSVRPEPGATVSTPLTWEEVEAREVRPQDFTIVTIHERIASQPDLFAPLLDEPVDVRDALEAMGVQAEPAPGSRAGIDEYVRKRDLEATPEPGPAPAPAEPEPPSGSQRFVIQKHAATRLHYDLRLERDGVLASWAVPKGLPTEQGRKHLAVQTEDHPLEYADFEGRIPEGNYGAGEMLIFDRGTYEALEWTEKKVTFRLHGERLRGEYHLVKTREGWLIFLSSRSPADLPHPPPELAPMLAEGGYQPFDDEGWRFEPKLDGIRTLAYVTPDETRLVSRTGRDQTAQYPELGRLAEYVNAANAVLDAEIVAFDEHGRPSFEQLQQRMNLSGPADIERARRSHPAWIYLFDVLWLDGRDLTSLAVEERRRLLEDIVTLEGPVRLTIYTDGGGLAFFEVVKQHGLEGMIAKRLGSPYQPGRRTRDWRKIKALNRQDCVILGWTPGSGSRSAAFGALLLGAFADGRLTWIGQVGTGFTGRLLEDLKQRLAAVESQEPAVDDPELRAVKGARWVRPELVCEVEFLERTSAGKLRAPSFKGLRPDKAPSDCHLLPSGG